MSVWSGNSTGSVTQVAYKIAAGLMSYSLVNKSGGGVVINLYVVDALGNSVLILPYNLTLSAGDSVFSSIPLTVAANSSIYMTVTGSVDYYFTVSDK